MDCQTAIISDDMDLVDELLKRGECCKLFKAEKSVSVLFNEKFSTPVKVHSISALHFALWQNVGINTVLRLINSVETTAIKSIVCATCLVDDGRGRPTNLTSPLYLSVQHCDLLTIQMLVKYGAEFNLGIDKARACLSQSKNSDKADILLYLISNDMITLKNIEGYASLHSRGDIEAIRKGNKNLLAMAAATGSASLVEKLLNQGVRCELYDTPSETSLSPLIFGLIKKIDCDLIKALLHNQDEDTVVKVVCTAPVYTFSGQVICSPILYHPLILAMHYCDLDTVKLLINKGATLTSIKSYLPDTLIHLFKNNEKIEIIKYFIEQGLIEVNETWCCGSHDPHPKSTQTILGLAACAGNCELVSYLVRKGSQFTGEPEEYLSLPKHLTLENKWEMLGVLLDNLSSIIPQQTGIIHFHISSLKAIFILLEHNTKYDLIHKIEFLIRKGVNINSEDNENRNILHYYLEKNHDPKKSIIEILINHGVDITKIDNKGRTSLHYLSKYCYLEDAHILTLLIETASNFMDVKQYLNTADQYGCNALHYFFRSPSMKSHFQTFVEILTSNGLSINATDNNGETPLHYVVTRGLNPHFIDVLCHFGANIHQMNNSGQDTFSLLADVELFIDYNNPNDPKKFALLNLIFRVIANKGNYLQLNQNNQSILDLILTKHNAYEFQVLHKIFNIIRDRPHSNITKTLKRIIKDFGRSMTMEQKEIEREYTSILYSNDNKNIYNSFPHQELSKLMQKLKTLKINENAILRKLLRTLDIITSYPDEGFPEKELCNAESMLNILASKKNGGPYWQFVILLFQKGFETALYEPAVNAFVNYLEIDERYHHDPVEVTPYIKRLRGCEPYTLKTISARFIFETLEQGSGIEHIKQLCLPTSLTQFIRSFEDRNLSWI